MALEREQILRTALKLLDEVGLDGLSLRRLAQELGVQAPALYWHFKNKQALLDELVVTARESAGAQISDRPAPGQTWDDWLLQGIREQRRMMLRHRDGARLAAGNRPTPDRWPAIESYLTVLVEAGFTAPDALRAVLVLGHYVSGFVLDEQRGSERAADEHPDLDPAEFPVLTAAAEAVADPDALFEYGLQSLMCGIKSGLPR